MTDREDIISYAKKGYKVILIPSNNKPTNKNLVKISLLSRISYYNYISIGTLNGNITKANTSVWNGNYWTVFNPNHPDKTGVWLFLVEPFQDNINNINKDELNMNFARQGNSNYPHLILYEQDSNGKTNIYDCYNGTCIVDYEYKTLPYHQPQRDVYGVYYRQITTFRPMFKL